MSQPVMVSIDGSEKDERAIAVAQSIAELSGAPLHLVHVIGATPGQVVAIPDVIVSEGTALDPDDEVSTVLSATAARVATETGRGVTWAVLQGRDVGRELLGHVEESEPLLVVMSTSAAGAAGRALRGSVSDHVMRESSRPVVLVPPGADDMKGKRVHVQRVLVPTDESQLAARALDFVLGLPNADRLELVLVRVVHPGADLAAAERVLHGLVERAHEAGAPQVEIEILEADDPARAICEAVRETLADAIAMSTRGAGGLRRMVMGSVAEGVVAKSEVPVLLLTARCLESEPAGGG